MLERLSPTRRNLALAGLGVALVWFSWTVRAVLNPLILGYLLAFVLNPLVRGLEARGLGRRFAANLIFLGFFSASTLLGLAVFLQGRALISDVGRSESFQVGLGQLEALADDWLDGSWGAGVGVPDADSELEGSPLGEGAGEEEPLAVAPLPREPGPGGLADPGRPEPAVDEAGTDPRELAILERILDRLGEGRSQARAIEGATVAWPYVRSFFGSMASLITLLILLPVYAYFLLFELDRINGFVRRYLPLAERARFSRIAGQIGEVLANFFRGRLLVCVIKGACLATGLAIVQVPYAVFLGIGSGFLSLVPFVGPLLGFGAAFLLAAFPPGAALGVGGGPDMEHLAFALARSGGVFVLAELLEGYVFLPRVLGDSLGLHPVVVLASIFIGGAALGMFGFLIALPLTAALVIVVRELVLPALADFADEPASQPDG